LLKKILLKKSSDKLLRNITLKIGTIIANESISRKTPTNKNKETIIK
jgi:hypothetical protein